MKFPRWLVVTMLSASVLAALGAGMKWWLSWPDRTATAFHELVIAGRLHEALHMLGTPSERRNSFELSETDTAPRFLTEAPRCRLDKPRELSDIVLGRRRFQLIFHEGLDWREEYIAQGGKVYQR
jgi:hypothetical protein